MIYLEHINLVVDNIPQMLNFYQAAFPIGTFGTKDLVSGMESLANGCILETRIITLR